ncbi:hypothetical protein Tco_0290289 [Tanacetum coccineum]
MLVKGSSRVDKINVVKGCLVTVEVNLRGLLELREKTSIFMNIWISLASPELTPLTGLMTPDLICPSTYQLLQSSSGDPRPNVSFVTSVSLEPFSGSVRARLAEVSKLRFFSGCSEGDYTSSCPPVAIPDYISWRHPDSTINDLKPLAGSFNMKDVRRLSTHVVKLRDMPEGVLVLSGLSRVWKSRTCDPVLRGANRNVIVIMEYLVNISKRRAFWSLNEDILKITILKTNTPYLLRKIRCIRACTHQRPQRNEAQYAVSRRTQYAVFKI